MPPLFYFKAMTITTFTISGGIMTLVLEDPSSPSTVLFTLPDNTTIARTTPDSTSGTEYTYLESVTQSEGIFSALVDAGLGTEVFGVIADLQTGVSCLLFKTLCEDLDCLLMQELYAIELYVYADDAIRSKTIYSRVVDKCQTCGTGATPEVVNSQIFIINGVKTQI
jgi:hypothetical protein